MQDFTPIVLLAGAEHLLRLEAAQAQRDQWRAQGFEERKVFHVDKKFDWNDVTAELYAPSLFAQRRVMELRIPSGKPGKEGSKVITDFCAQPSADTAVLVLCDEWSKKHEGAWSEAIARCGRKEVIWPVGIRQLPSWTQKRLHSRGLPSDASLVDVLVTRSEGNLLALAQEIDKLVLLLDDRHGMPDSDTLLALVSDQSHFDIFGLCDALLQGQLPRAIRAMNSLRGEGERVAALLPMITSTLLELDTAVRGGTVRSWPARKRMLEQAARNIAPAQMDAVMAQLAQVELVSKGRASGDEWLGLERLLWLVVHRKAPQDIRREMDGRRRGLHA